QRDLLVWGTDMALDVLDGSSASCRDFVRQHDNSRVTALSRLRGQTRASTKGLHANWWRCRSPGAAGRTKPRGRTPSAPLGPYYSRYETHRPGALGRNGFGCFSAIRRYQHYFL